MDISNIDLNKPVSWTASKKEETLVEEPPSETAEIKPKETADDDTADTLVEGNKVRYQRFQNVLQRAKEAEQKAAEAEARAEELRRQYESYRPVQPSSDLPSYWIKLYGDSPESAEAYKIDREQKDLMRQEAREEAIRAVQEQQREEVRVNQENLNTIDTHLEALTEYVGRELTESEQSSVLDIVNEFTPQDEEGNYLGALLPFDKAWDIYEMKNQVEKAPRRQSRDNVASLTGSQTSGDTSIQAEKNKNFNPLDWGGWRDRLSEK